MRFRLRNFKAEIFLGVLQRKGDPQKGGTLGAPRVVTKRALEKPPSSQRGPNYLLLFFLFRGNDFQ